MRISYPPGFDVDQAVERIVACLNDIDEDNLSATIDLTNKTIIMPASWVGHVIPAVDDTYDLGSSALQWRNLYLDGLAYIDALGEDLDVNQQDLSNVDDLTGKVCKTALGTWTIDTAYTVPTGEYWLATEIIVNDTLTVNGSLKSETW